MRILWLSGFVVLLDQATKLVVLQTMYRSQSIPIVGEWLSLTFTENPGMAFGITFGPAGLITYFSIFATLVILVYLFRIRTAYGPYRFSLALVLGGAFGNIIDRVFYGALFYGEPLFQGRVVDFIHINVWRGYVPESIPLLGGKYFALFPIWNVADMAIVVGVVGILLFQKAFHKHREIAEADPSAADASHPVAVPGTLLSTDPAAVPVPSVETAPTASDSDESDLNEPVPPTDRETQ